MKRDLHFVPGAPGYVVHWHGEVTLDAVAEHWRDLATRPEFEPTLAALHDLRGVSAARTLSGTFASARTYRDVGVAGEGRVAFLVDDPAIYGLARQLTTIFGVADSACVTHAAAEALAWVGLPADYCFPY